MTREEAINEINKVFEPAFANYIITALTEGATVSDKEPTTKNDLGVDREDAVEKLNALKQFIGYDKGSEIVKATQKSLDIAIKALEQEPILEKDGTLIVTTEHYENVGRVLVEYGTNGTLFYQDQEPFMNKPCISSKVCEHDKEVVLDKIKAEIEKQEKWLLQAGYNTYNVDIAFNSIKLALTESEIEDGNDN